ncbi:MAG: PHP domain-containing protein [Planctomycetes bacterium]|nr:PHP domain-containing protein [Planctomycetota bacterium]
MKIINPGPKDFHIHSFTYSDGMNTVDEIVQHAGRVGLKTIAICDHSEVYMHAFGYPKKTGRGMVNRWRNVHNDVEVIFGIEADIISDAGDISADIQGVPSDFLILSTHRKPYSGDSARITQAYLNAIARHGERIRMLGHPCSVYFEDHLDIDPIIELANEKGIPMEFNCANYVTSRTHMANLEKMLTTCNEIYINSDGHTLHEIETLRKRGIGFLKEKGFWPS